MNTSSAPEIQKANEILSAKLKEILSVQEWAETLGYHDMARFSREYRNHFGERPKEHMVKIRLEKAIGLLRNNPKISCYEVAQSIGKKDEKALHRYFMIHANTPPSAFRQKRRTKSEDKK